MFGDSPDGTRTSVQKVNIALRKILGSDKEAAEENKDIDEQARSFFAGAALVESGSPAPGATLGYPQLKDKDSVDTAICREPGRYLASETRERLGGCIERAGPGC